MRRFGLTLVLGISLSATCGGEGVKVSGTGGTSTAGSTTVVGGGIGGATGIAGSTASPDAGVLGPDGGLLPNCRPRLPCPSGWFTYSDTVCSPPYLGSGAG